MFPRKQYKSRNTRGYIEDLGSPIYTKCSKNMPYGSVTYPYRERNDEVSINTWDDKNKDDVFAVYTQLGWRFFQADRDGGNIFKMWRFSGVEACPGCIDGSKVRPIRYAYHLNQETLSGKMFMQEMTMGDDDYEKRYLSVNILPIQDAYYSYESLATEDVRKYKICSSEDAGVGWDYTLYLAPRLYHNSENIIKTDIIRNIHFEIGNLQDDYIDYTGEYATRTMSGPLGNGENNIITAAWGEYAGVQDEITKHQYFYIEVIDKEGADGMVYIQSSSNMTIYDKAGENDNYSRLLYIIKHDEGEDKDTVLETCEGDNNDNENIVNRCLFQSHKIKDTNNDIEYIKTSLGGLILPDDVTVFLFDSCEEDEERLLIRDTLIKKYNMQIKYGDSLKTLNEPILSYTPDLCLMKQDDKILEAIIEKCKIPK